MNEVFKSKRFWIAVSGVVAVVLQDKLPFSEDQLQQIILLAATWIVGDSLRATAPGARR